MNKEQLQDKMARFQEALKTQRAIIKEHQQKVAYCKSVIELCKMDLEIIAEEERRAKYSKPEPEQTDADIEWQMVMDEANANL